MATPFPATLRLNCLMVSADPTTLREVARSAAELAIVVHEWSGFEDLPNLLKQRKFEGVVIDYRIAKKVAFEAIKIIRLSASNRSAVVLAITESDDQIASAFLAGANLTIKRPLSSESILSTLKLAYGSMLRERRRYFRAIIAVPVSVEQGESLYQCQTVNVSEGGMAVVHENTLRLDRRNIVRFRLPEDCEIVADAIVRWSKAGLAGLQFLSLRAWHKAQLQSWLAQKLEEKLPESVSGRFW